MMPRSQVRAGSVACMGCHQAASTSSTVPNGGSMTVTPAAPLTRRARRSRDGGDQVGPGDQERQRQPAPGGRHHARGDAKPAERRGDQACLRQPGRRVRQRGQVLGGEAAVTQPGVGRVGDVHDPVPQEHLRVAVGAEPARPDEHVVPEQAVVGLQQRRGDRPRVELHPRRQLVHPPQHAAQREDGLRRDRDREPAPAGRRIELGGHAERPLHLAECLPHGGQQAAGHRGELVLAPGPDEKLIAEVLPQPGERAAHRRLAEAEPLPRPRHVAVFEQRAQHGQKVKVDASRACHETSLSANTRQIATYSHFNHIISTDHYGLISTGVTAWRSVAST